MAAVNRIILLQAVRAGKERVSADFWSAAALCDGG